MVKEWEYHQEQAEGDTHLSRSPTDWFLTQFVRTPLQLNTSVGGGPYIMMNGLRCILLLFLCSLEYSQGLKILAFLPMPWRSHQFVYRQFIKGLSSKGHEVDFYTPTPMSDPPPTLNQIQVKDRLNDATDVIDDEEFMNASPYRSTEIVYDVTMHILKKMFEEEQVYKDLLNSKKKYDVIIMEYPLASESTAYLAHKFKAPLVAIMGYLDHPWTNELSGLPDNPSYMISYLGRTNDKMNFLQRLYNFYTTVSMLVECYYELVTRQQAFADKYIKYEGWESRPKLTQIVSDADLILVNSHHSIGYPYPKAPHVKDVAGMHITPPSPLPKDIQKFMDDAPHGVIYFSLGSVVDANVMLGGGKFEAFVNVFKRLKQKVVWKIGPGMGEVKEANILTKEWLPQQDILRHKNTVLFITHGGLQSTVETINYGIPVIGMPVFFDQIKDITFLTTVGMGRALHYDNMTESTISWTINEMMTNPSYRQNAKKRQQIFNDRPMKPVDEAVYWIEYVARHGKILQPASAKMPFYQVYLLDVLATILVFACVVICVIKEFLRKLCSLICSKSCKEKQPKRKIN